MKDTTAVVKDSSRPRRSAIVHAPLGCVHGLCERFFSTAGEECDVTARQLKVIQDPSDAMNWLRLLVRNAPQRAVVKVPTGSHGGMVTGQEWECNSVTAHPEVPRVPPSRHARRWETLIDRGW